jgi:hypothetical protein
MSTSDTKLLFTINDRLVAEEIQRLLEESEIYSMLVSDNPASSALNAFMGSNPMETVALIVNIADYKKAVEIVSKTQFIELIVKE